MEAKTTDGTDQHCMAAIARPLMSWVIALRDILLMVYG